MDQHLIFILFGLANGAVYAALGLTLVVTYRSSGVVNFAAGSLALLGAYEYAYLREGLLLIPIPFLPSTVDLGGELVFWSAAPIAVVMTSLVGLLLYLGVFRPLRAVPPVGKAVASIGVMLAIAGILAKQAGTEAVLTGPVLPTDSWTIGSVRVSQDRVWLAAIVLAITVALSLAYRFTKFGLHTRAAAESEKGAFLSGLHPDRIAAVNWMISGAIAAIAGILIAPIVPLTPDRFTLMIVPALAAAVIGQFQYMVPAVLGGLAIGMVQSEVTYLSGKVSWMPSSGRDELVVLCLVLILLVARAKPLPSRGAVLKSTLGRAPRPHSILKPTLICVPIAVAGLFLLSGDWLIALIYSLIMAILGLSMVVVTGYAGQVSLAQLTLAGVAGFALAGLTEGWGVPFPLAPLLAALIAAAFGVLVGLPALRVRGLPVAVVTLATAVALEAVWFHNLDYAGAAGKDVTGPTFLGLDLRAQVGFDYPRPQFGLLVLATLVVVAIGVAKLRTSTLGSQMLAVRANERAAAGAGVAVVRVKLLAFAIGAFIAGLSGTMIGYMQANVTWMSFTALLGLTIFATAYLAGVTSVSGGILSGFLAVGGLFPFVLDKWFSLGGSYTVLAGVGLVITLMTNPEGVLGPVHERRARRRRERERGQVEMQIAPDAEAVLEWQPPVAGGDVLLSVSNVRVTYGGVVAVDGVSVDVRQGTIVGLIGPNGAGKTTLVDAITGFTRSTGSIAVVGRDLNGLTPYQRVRAGLGRTFQHTELYDDLTVTENVMVGTAAAAGRQARTLEETLDVLGITEYADYPVAELSQGRRQLVSIARALIGNPQVLLLDEPAGGLDSRESQWLGLRLRSLRDAGVSILLIDHDMNLVLNLCDDIYVIDFGKVIAHGAPTDIRNDPKVTAAYLGSSQDEDTPHPELPEQREQEVLAP